MEDELDKVTEFLLLHIKEPTVSETGVQFHFIEGLHWPGRIEMVMAIEDHTRKADVCDSATWMLANEWRRRLDDFQGSPPRSIEEHICDMHMRRGLNAAAIARELNRLIGDFVRGHLRHGDSLQLAIRIMNYIGIDKDTTPEMYIEEAMDNIGARRKPFPRLAGPIQKDRVRERLKSCKDDNKG